MSVALGHSGTEAQKALVIDSDTANAESVSSVLTASGFLVRTEAGRQD